MVFCSKCGTQTDDGGVYCPNCGYQLTKEKQTMESQELLSLVNFKSIIFGGIVAIPFFVIIIIYIISMLLSLSYNMSLAAYGDSLFLIDIVGYYFLFQVPTLFGGLVAGYTSGSDHRGGIINGLVLAIILSFFAFIFFIGPSLIPGGIMLIIFLILVAGAVGGFIGAEIKKRTRG